MWLVECVGTGGLVARLGGDEFGVLPPLSASDPEAIEQLTRRLVACAQE